MKRSTQKEKEAKVKKIGAMKPKQHECASVPAGYIPPMKK